MVRGEEGRSEGASGVLRSKILLKVRGKGASGKIQINYRSGEQSGREGRRMGGILKTSAAREWISIRNFGGRANRTYSMA